ncbi:ABC transporter permease subunit [Micrococcus sp. JV4]|uniref:ABC transporter permease n=1 Tax=unclassified Micrococcus TaxID=2620948 RepID=UPI0005CC1A8F|nr:MULTISPECIES: ABC transporter permease [unclassified Micrococcus]MBM4623135.1 ABC transporter permease subunit [Micrococcus sp. JV4]RYC99920.1 ABC transporter permease [Micrococcus sp. MS-ASIII-49]
MSEFLASRWPDILFRAWQHRWLVLQALAIATVLAIALAVIATRIKALTPIANAFTAVGLTLPSFALIGVLIPLVGIGTVPAVVVVVFYALLPILRNAPVGLRGVDPEVLEAARGMGMGPVALFTRVRLPLAWPVILTGIRVAGQLGMGVAAVAAYVLGPGLGSYIFTGLVSLGGANALNYALVGTLGIVVVALVLDGLLVLLGRVTISKGLRA